MKQVINHKSVAAVVVTYNRIEMLKQCIDHLKRQSYKLQRIYVIDNASTDGTYEEFCKKEDIAYYRLAENEGGSGGFYCGIKKAYEDGYDYIWGMDDDAFPSYDALCKIMEQVNRMSKDVCFWSNCDEDIEFKDNVKEVNDILRFPAGDRRKVKAILIRCPRKLGKTILFRPQNIPIVIKGIMHGLEGKSGKYIEP